MKPRAARWKPDAAARLALRRFALRAVWPSPEERRALASRLHTTEHRVRFWFQNLRQRNADWLLDPRRRKTLDRVIVIAEALRARDRLRALSARECMESGTRGDGGDDSLS